MSANLQNLLRDSLLNNSYDYSSMHNALKMTWENSFSYLYKYQQNYIEYEELHYYSSDTLTRDREKIGKLYCNKYNEACFDIEYDFIHVCNREEYYHSKYYLNRFTFMDMVNHPEIFTKLPIIMIDDKVIYDYKIKGKKGTFTIILPFKRDFVIDLKRNQETDDIIYLDHKIQIMVVDNVFYERVQINRNNLTFNDDNKSISVRLSTLTKKLPKNKTGMYCVSFHLPNTFGAKYELGSMLCPSLYDEAEGIITASLGDEEYDKIKNFTSEMYLSVIYSHLLHCHGFYTGNPYTVCQKDGDCNLFVLQRAENQPYAMPVPVENFMIYKRSVDTGKYTLLKNTDTVELHYPNIYKIIDKDRKEGDLYRVFYFYQYGDFLKYRYIFSYFYTFLKIRYKDETPIEKIIDTMYHGTDDESDLTDEAKKALAEDFKKIISYEYYNHRYGEVDFVKRYTLEKGNEDKEPTEYKDETLRYWIAVDPFVLRDYVREQDKLATQVYHLWTNTIDLSKRLRTSTTPELGEGKGFDLDGEYYVFAFRNEDTTSGKLLDIRIFADGLFVMDPHQVRMQYTDYFYIPKDMVTEDSYIEIELYPSYACTKKLKFTSKEDVQSFDLYEPENQIYPTAKDIYYINPDGYMMDILGDSSQSNTGTGDDTVRIASTDAVTMKYNGHEYKETHIYDNDFFDITSKYTRGSFPVKTTDEDKPVKFTRMVHFDIKPNSDEVLNKDIDFCISKVPNGILCEVPKTCYPYIALVENKFKFNIEYIRIFRNGRLVPRQKYLFFSSYSFPRIMFLEQYKKGDVIYIDITPYRYKEIYYQPELEEKQTLINLKGIITKPFDIRYYDVYMNGRKLGLENVFTISPWEITLTNLKSLYNLQIFEKERDYEYFGTNYKEAKYYYTIDDLLNSKYITEDQKNELIKRMIDGSKDKHCNIYPNTNDEERMDFDDERRFAYVECFYFNELVPKTYVNPDRIQFDNTIMEEEYPFIVEMYKKYPSKTFRTLAEQIRRQAYRNVIALDPDTYIEGKAGKGTQYVYCVGFPDDVPDEFLNQKITILNDPDIS